MSNSAEEQLKTTLEREQKHFESLARSSDIESTKTKILQKADDQLGANKTKVRSNYLKTPPYFAVAATLILSISILFYLLLSPTQLHLITEIEINNERQFIATLTETELLSLQAVEMSIDPEFPIITLEQPDNLKDIKSPLDLLLTFDASPNSEIYLDSFKLTYGLSETDITERLLGVAAITSDQVKIEEIYLPSGNHIFTVSITDSKGRTSNARYKFIIK